MQNTVNVYTQNHCLVFKDSYSTKESENLVMSKLATAIKKSQNYTTTENGALSLKSTNSELLDLFSNGAAKRNDQSGLVNLFRKALSEDEVLAVTCGFYIGAVRVGQGERASFRSILNYLADNRPETFLKVYKFVPEFSRWDNLLKFATHPNVGDAVTKLVRETYYSELDSQKPSLFWKWTPSINASSKETVRLAAYFASVLGLSQKQYRRDLSKMRAKLKIVEADMSANRWDKISYTAVPSKAAKLYRKAFKKHDETRYNEFIQKAVKGEVKINSKVMYPYELVEGYLNGKLYANDDTIEAQWRQLPNYAETPQGVNALVIPDVSGSMSGQPMAVSISLAIYLSERMNGLFKNKFITFSNKPELQEVRGKTLYEKVQNLERAHWEMNTNFQAVFDLILSTAVKEGLTQVDMPTHVFCVSDMAFDMAAHSNSKTNFEVIKEKYQKAGYEMPILVFWNVRASAGGTPVTKDEKGVYLVSGCSPSIFRSAINTKAVTPEDLMLEVLNDVKFAKVRDALAV